MSILKNKKEAENSEKSSFLEKAKTRFNRFSLFLTFLGAIFFILTTLLYFGKNFKDSPFFPFILGSVILYLLVFVILIIVHRNDKKSVKSDTKRFKSTIKFIKIILDILFILSSLLIFIQSLNLDASNGLFKIIETLFSGALLFIKLFIDLIKLFIWNLMRKRRLKNEAKAKLKQNKSNNNQ